MAISIDKVVLKEHLGLSLFPQNVSNDVFFLSMLWGAEYKHRG